MIALHNDKKVPENSETSVRNRLTSLPIRLFAYSLFLVLTFQYEIAAAVSETDKMPEPGKRFALIVGISKYTDKRINSLRGPSNDAVAIRAALRAAGFPDDNILVLTAEQPDERTPCVVRVARRHRQ